MVYSPGIWSWVQGWECGWKLSSGLAATETVILRAELDVCALRVPGSFIYRGHFVPGPRLPPHPNSCCMDRAHEGDGLSPSCLSDPGPWSQCSASSIHPRHSRLWHSGTSFWFLNAELSLALIMSNTHEWDTEFLFMVTKFWKQWWWLNNMVNVITNATELYT